VLAFFLTWLPTYLTKGRGMDQTTMGLYAGLTSGALCISVLVAGRVMAAVEASSRFRAISNQLVGSIGLMMCSICTAILSFANSDFAVLILSCLAVSALAFVQVATWSAVQKFGGVATGALTGMVALVGNFASGASPLLSALIVDQTSSWGPMFAMFCGISLAGGLCWLAMMRSAIRSVRAD
jgi:cyanate permease